jgi:hypothetical protein
MAALGRVLLKVTGVDIDTETLKTLVIFSGIGLLVSVVLAMAYGLDLSPVVF